MRQESWLLAAQLSLARAHYRWRCDEFRELREGAAERSRASTHVWDGGEFIQQIEKETER